MFVVFIKTYPVFVNFKLSNQTVNTFQQTRNVKRSQVISNIPRALRYRATECNLRSFSLLRYTKWFFFYAKSVSTFSGNFYGYCCYSNEVKETEYFTQIFLNNR